MDDLAIVKKRRLMLRAAYLSAGAWLAYCAVGYAHAYYLEGIIQLGVIALVIGVAWP